MILLIDNYDSFTHILAAKLAAIDEVFVLRNDKPTLRDVEDMNPERIVLSPGPGGPLDSGICLDVLRRIARAPPLPGRCLGHPCIAHVFGGGGGRRPRRVRPGPGARAGRAATGG